MTVVVTVLYDRQPLIQFLANVNYVTFAICYRRSVCRLSGCLSVTLVHPTQAVEIFGTFFHRTIAHSFLMPKLVGGGRPFALKFAFNVTHPHFKQRNFDQYRLIAPQP